MKIQFRKQSALLCLIIISSAQVYSQNIPDSIIKKIDSLFKPWNNSTGPGCSIGIVRNDSLVYARGYGMANLEYDIPNTPSTIFHMASVSKQFTAYSIVLLARQGKLSLDDDIRKYLNWFPYLGQKITIRNLLNHTSGIRDQWQLLAIAGTRIDDVITQEHIVKLLSKQQALNFKPGDEYSYSNSGFTTLAEIVRSVTDQTLRKFTDSAIFKPLGMNSTHFHDNYTEIEKGRAYSYQSTDSIHFANSILSYSNAGATSLFTNVGDMSKWIINFYTPTVGDGQDIKQLTQHGRLNNGEQLDYAFGIVADKYKGWTRYEHNGADAGYRTSIGVFPTLKMGFIVFSNDGDFDAGGKTEALAALFVKDSSKQAALKTGKVLDSSKAILKDTQSVAAFSGDYISDDGTQFSFKTENRKMYWLVGDSKFLLIKTKKDTFNVFTSMDVKFVFSITASKDTIVQEYWPGRHRLLAKYIADTAQTDQQLSQYTGTYYCPELDCKYGIVLKDHHLLFTNNKYDNARITLVGNRHLVCDYWWMDHLLVSRDSQHKISGFEVDAGRIRHLVFKKIE